ncbi:MAG: hypothetical protein M0Z79_07775 [Nitrospiraceae bacterium]|nr:hypothetical protein [Nitrospiraceae bacterium]
MKKNIKILCMAVILLAASVSASCMSGVRLNTQGARDSEVAGTYSVIFYGCNFNNDFETVAFLDKDGDGYAFEPYAPDFKYRVKRGLGAKDALSEAERFVNCGTAFRNIQLYKIIGPRGDILGYEVRPLYYPFVYGADDVLYTGYALRGDKVVITVSLAPWVENMLSGGRSHNGRD